LNIQFPDKKYKVIYADPPWQYKNYNYAQTKVGQKAKRGVVKEYSVMDIGDIKQLPVNQISDDNCILFLVWKLYIQIPIPP
jgi:N6-adenosine-specific RNA methylase IME4